MFPATSVPRKASMQTSVDDSTTSRLLCEGMSFVVSGGKNVPVYGGRPDKYPVPGMDSGQLQ